MMDNERRADIGQAAIEKGATMTNVITQESISTCITDVLAYIAHFCVRVGLELESEFRQALESYEDDYEDGPGAERILTSIDADEAGWELLP